MEDINVLFKGSLMLLGAVMIIFVSLGVLYLSLCVFEEIFEIDLLSKLKRRNKNENL